MDAYYFLEMKPYQVDIYLLDVITTMSILPMELFFSTGCIQAMSTRQFFRQMSPSPVFVNIQGHASLQSTYLIMLVPFV